MYKQPAMSFDIIVGDELVKYFQTHWVLKVKLLQLSTSTIYIVFGSNFLLSKDIFPISILYIFYLCHLEVSNRVLADLFKFLVQLW